MSNNPSMKLNELLDQYQNIDDDRERTKQQRNVIFCIDQALHEVNDNGYSVDSFDPHDITVFPDKVIFDVMSEINGDEDKIIRKNIMDSAILSIRIYLNYFDDMNELHDSIEKLFTRSEELLGDNL